MSRTLYAGTAPARRKILTFALFAGLAFAAAAGSARVASAQTVTAGSPDLVISQVYTRGGEPGATFRNDFVEIFNRGNATVNLADYSLQVLVNTTTPTGGTTVLVPVTVRFGSFGGGFPVAPGKYVLYQFGSGGSNGAPLPTAEFAGAPSNLDLPSDTGRVALIKGLGLAPAVPFAQRGCPSGVDAALGDFFSYGAATCTEGVSANFPAPSPTTAAVRNSAGCADADNTAADFATAAPKPRNSAAAAGPCNLTASPRTVQFETDTVNVDEGAGFAEIFVTRTDASAAAGLEYATVDDTASERSDYTTALGRVGFPAGVSRVSFRVLITDDARPEGAESFTVALNYPSNGHALGARHIARVNVNDNDAAAGANPVDSTDFFVRQHYADFLSRAPDAGGFQFWTGEIEQCGSDLQCREVKRNNVSAAFFLSIEFQETGFFVHRLYKALYPDSDSRPGGFPLYRELWHDTQLLANRIVTEQGTLDQGQLEANKTGYLNLLISRPEFRLRYPDAMTQDPSTRMTSEQFVDAINANAGGAWSQAERDREVNELRNNGGGPEARVFTVRRLLEDEDFKRAEFNRAFVLMEYFGYLRRFPTDPPEPDLNFEGYYFWLGKLTAFNGNYIQAEMVKAFINSTEYRARFLTPAP
ncbi:MAG TPA: Calx-beta domain-containing protein [Pyrinomonadaceae bacterium]|jgi:hypothetical protein